MALVLFLGFLLALALTSLAWGADSRPGIDSNQPNW
jgi:hypothetical protein